MVYDGVQFEIEWKWMKHNENEWNIMELIWTYRMKEVSRQPTALLGQAAGCRPLEPVSLVSSTVLVPFISGSLWPAKWQQDVTCFWRFAAIFMLFPPRVQRCWRKNWKIMGNHKHSQTFPSTSESFHPPTSTNHTKEPQCHEYPQGAHSLTQSPWVP